MQNTKFLALDVGSSVLRLCEVAVEEGRLDIKEYSEVDYGGFTDGQFLDADISDAVKELLSDVNREEYTKIYVNVPSEFCGIIKKDITQSYPAPIELNEFLRRKFLKNATIEQSEINGVVIKKMLGDFEPHSSTHIDGENEQDDLTAEVTFIYASNDFVNNITAKLAECGFTDVEYKCGIVEQAHEMAKSHLREAGIVLIDVGYLTTSVLAFKGESVESLYSFSLGGAHITANLSEAFDLPFKVAEQLKRKVLLTVDPSEVDYYVVTDDDGNEYELKASQVNAVVTAKIEHIAKMTAKCLSEGQYVYQFLVTGGGLCEMKGALNVFSSALGVVCKAEKLEMGGLDEYGQSAITSLIKTSYHSEKEDYLNLPFYQKWWIKLKGLFKK